MKYLFLTKNIFKANKVQYKPFSIPTHSKFINFFVKKDNAIGKMSLMVLLNLLSLRGIIFGEAINLFTHQLAGSQANPHLTNRDITANPSLKLIYS